MKLDFAIDYMNILEADDDTTLVELYLLHTGKNRNQYIINRDAVERAIPTIYNKPIIYRLNNEFIPSMSTDVLEHGTVEDRGMRIAGVIPESAPMEFVEMNGKEYLRTKGVIYKIYQPSLMNILANRGGNVKISMEIIVLDSFEEEDGSWNVTDFKFEGVALLGKDILEGIEGSQLNVLKFSAKDFNEHYMGFATKEIPKSVKEAVREALDKRTLRGVGGSSASVNMAKYLLGNDYIDNIRLNKLKDYFGKPKNEEKLSFALYGGNATKEWINEILNGKRVKNTMKNISEEQVRNQIHEFLEELGGIDKWRYWIQTLYIEPKQVIIVDEVENKFYLVPFDIMEEAIVVKWEEREEVTRCYIPTQEVDENTLVFKLREVLSIGENGQLISNTHILSTVNSSVARKAESLLNSLEKEDEEVKKEKKNACDEEEVKVDNCGNVDNCDNCKNCDTKMNAKDEAEKVEDEEKAEDRKEDDKEEDDEKEDFAARIEALTKENTELKASLEVYKKKEEVEKMNALIEEFSYCFAKDEKDELINSLETKTFAEVDNIVNSKVREFVKKKVEKEEDKKQVEYSIGLLSKNFSYEENKEVKTLKDIKEKYSK